MLIIKLRRVAGRVESKSLFLEKLETNPVLVKADVICDERSKAEHFHSKSNFVVVLWVLNSCPAM